MGDDERRARRGRSWRGERRDHQRERIRPSSWLVRRACVSRVTARRPAASPRRRHPGTASSSGGRAAARPDAWSRPARAARRGRCRPCCRRWPGSRCARREDSRQPDVTPHVGSAAPSPKYRTLAWVVLGASSTRRVALSGDVPARSCRRGRCGRCRAPSIERRRHRRVVGRAHRLDVLGFGMQRVVVPRRQVDVIEQLPAQHDVTAALGVGGTPPNSSRRKTRARRNEAMPARTASTMPA